MVAGAGGRYQPAEVKVGREDWRQDRDPRWAWRGAEDCRLGAVPAGFGSEPERDKDYSARRRADDADGAAAVIAALIRAAIRRRVLVLIAAALLKAVGIWSLRSTAIDALPDLSDVQVIIRTSHPGPGAADCRKPDDLSAGDDDAVGPRSSRRARLFVRRRQLRLCPLQGRHQPLLGTQPGARISEPVAGATAEGRDRLARKTADDS